MVGFVGGMRVEALVSDIAWLKGSLGSLEVQFVGGGVGRFVDDLVVGESVRGHVIYESNDHRPRPG